MEEQATYAVAKPIIMKSLEELFGRVINTRGIHHKLGMEETKVRTMRKRYNDGGGISVKKMREVLQLAGFEKVQEEMWAGRE